MGLGVWGKKKWDLDGCYHSGTTDEQGKIGLLGQWTMEGWDEQIGCTLQQIHVFLLFIKDIYNCFLPQYIHQSTVLPRDSFSKSSASLPFPFLLNHICVSLPGWGICQLLLLFWQGFLRSNAFFKVAFVLVRFFATLFLCVLLPQQWLRKYFLSPHWWWRKCLPFTISVDLLTSFSCHIFYQRQWKWWSARFKAQRQKWARWKYVVMTENQNGNCWVDSENAYLEIFERDPRTKTPFFFHFGMVLKTLPKCF